MPIEEHSNTNLADFTDEITVHGAFEVVRSGLRRNAFPGELRDHVAKLCVLRGGRVERMHTIST
jgi:hypothetical protein